MTIEQMAEIRRIQRLIEQERKLIRLDARAVELDKELVQGKVSVGLEEGQGYV